MTRKAGKTTVKMTAEERDAALEGEEPTLPSVRDPRHMTQWQQYELGFYEWLGARGWGWLWRILLTVVAAYSVWRLSGADYKIDFGTMVLAAGITVLITRVWASWP